MAGEKLLFRLEQPHGTGDVYVAWQPGSGMYLATTGLDSMVNVFDRYGTVVERIRLPSVCASLGWDADGDLLAVVSQSQLVVWDANTTKKSTIDVGLKDSLSCLTWAKTAPFLAVGTVKGNISIFNYNTSKRIPVIGKHAKKITCGAWNKDNLLAFGSEDKTISLSNSEGDTVKIVNLRAEPADLQFADIKMDNRVATDNTVSAVVGKRTLYLYKLLDPDNPFELAFQQHYGTIVTYQWYGDGYILIGFSAGYFVAISTHIKEVGQELFQVRDHKNLLNHVTICPVGGKAASCGDNSVKIHDLTNLQETSAVIGLPMESGLERLAWSADGQLLAVVTKSGSVNVYVSQMQQLTAVCPPKIAILSSLTEVSVYHYEAERDKSMPIYVNLSIEPTFIGVGQYHLAAGMNNRVWFYDLTKTNAEDAAAPLTDRQYLGAVTSVKLNPEYASVLFEGKIQLHMIEQPEVCHEDRESIVFPEPSNRDCSITCHELTTDFLIYGTDTGRLVHFHVEEWSKAMEHQHDAAIGAIYADPAGTRLVLVDVKGGGYVFNAVTCESVPIPDVPAKINGVTWDSNIADRNVFILFDSNDIYTYLYVKCHLDGTRVVKIGNTVLVSRQTPLLMYGGAVMCATSNGQLSQLALSTHDAPPLSGSLDRDDAVLEGSFRKQLALHRFASAWRTCQTLKSRTSYVTLAEECLKSLQLDAAVRIYAHLDEVAMVESVERLRDKDGATEEQLGHVALLLGRHDDAQAWLLRAAQPRVALEMRRDLLQWERALQLASSVAMSDEVAVISREYAQQLEFLANYPEALQHYEAALQENLSADHTRMCRAGIARTALHCGNHRHGISIAMEMADDQLYQECAAILENKRQHNDAAILYEKCRQFDKAAACHATLKNWTKVGDLLPHITANRLHLLYAKAMEAAGRYEEAVKAYEKARDHDSLIRIHLERLNNPEIAVDLVQETKSVEGAKMVAKFFQNLNDTASAVKFLVLSKCADDAFELARKSGKVELYGDVLLTAFTSDDVQPKHFAPVAQHFENERDPLLAGKYWFHAREYRKALNHLLIAARSNAKEKEAIATAIDAVASSGDEALAHALIEFLLGDADGTPKDPRYLFRLYMARKQYREASKSALIIANDEQINGFYRNAHDVLFAMCQELKQNGIAIPLEMYNNLQLLHSYILVRMHVKRGDHGKAAPLLMRVAANVSKFPAHVVPILTSTVIECHRAGLRHAAYKYATVLMNPEYRKQIDAKYAKKIEAVVRRAPKGGADGDRPDDGAAGGNETSCPYCDRPLPPFELACNNCKNTLPFCVVTGRHVTKRATMTCCPHCDFPAYYDDFVELLATEHACPMCSEPCDSDRLRVIDDVTDYLTVE